MLEDRHSWKTKDSQLVIFPIVFVLTVFRCSILCTVSFCVLDWMRIMESVSDTVHWRPCCSRKCAFRLTKTRRNLNFLGCIHVLDLLLKCCSERNEGNRMQFLFYFIVLVNIVASFIGRRFLSVSRVLS